MEDYLDENAPARLPGRKYAQSEASEKISEASGAPREVLEVVDGTGGEAPVYQKNKTNVLQAQRAVRGYCAMSTAEKDAEDKKKSISVSRRGPHGCVWSWREEYSGSKNHFGCKWIFHSEHEGYSGYGSGAAGA